MKSLISRVVRRSRESERGFTLIEMLIVVGIIVALAAAIVPQVVQFGGKGEEGEKAAELSAVQSAVDSMLADKGITALTAATGMNIWTTCPKEPGATSVVLNGGTTDYLRETSTKWLYDYTAAGKVTQGTKVVTDAGC